MDTTTDTATPLVEAREAPDSIPDDLSEIFPKLAPKPIAARRLDQARAFVARIWAPPNEASLDLILLWALACHVTDENMRLLFNEFPRLFIGSKSPGSGKSTLLRLLAGPLNGESDGLCPRGEWTSDPSAPSLRGLLHGCRATVFLDQADTKQGGGTFPSETRNILNQGYSRGATVTRGGSSPNAPVIRLRIDGPICLGGLWGPFLSHPELTDVRSRTLMILATKRRPAQRLEPLDWMDHAAPLQGHHDALAAVAELIKWDASRARPTAPGFDDRDLQLVRPLLAVADAVGGDWPERARNATKVVLRGATDTMDKPEPKNPFEVLMRDLGLVWSPEEERLPTREIVNRLVDLPNSAWSRFETPQGAGREIVKILRPEGAEPRTFRVPGGEPCKGYLRDDLVRLCGLELAPLPDDDEDPFG